MIEVKALTKSSGTLYALRGINLSIAEGALLSIFGPNGAGKTTFIRILATLSKATSGEIHIAGQSIRDNPQEIRRRLGVIAHSTYLYDELTAGENLQFYAKLYGLANAKERIGEVLQEVGLGKRQDDLVRTFSRGMQQRLSIARAMLHNPDILLLDEPYTGLDQHASRMLTEWLGKLRSEKRTIVMVTHNLANGIALADRVAVFLRGKVAYQGEVDRHDAAGFENIYFDIVSGGGVT